ncbi:MAG: hypothetical protein O6930_04555 [Gammaproteobacteria bacterium]|nr:hypothetical protein [Gammaproteobacteria bacterium]
MEIMRISRHRSIATGLLGVLAGTYLVGCASVVTVEAEFPAPVVETLPVRIGLIFDEALTSYEYYEKIPQQATWTIYLGNANETMLGGLFDTMFVETRAVDEVPLTPTDLYNLDGVLRTELEKFEFEVPISKRDEFVEVWMQYRLTLYEPDGTLVVEWPVSGYGKSESGKNEQALHRATVVAMREVGAAISTRFAEQPRIEYWLQERHNAAALSADFPLTN